MSHWISVQRYSIDGMCIHLAADHLCHPFFLPLLCRYKIYAEGFAWSVSLKYILSCGSLSLIISPEYEDFFSRGLIPKKNYWPVSPTDLCPSIKYAVDWGNEHPSEVCFHLTLYQYIMSLLDYPAIGSGRWSQLSVGFTTG